MALCKEIQLDNGVVTNYHRIVSINQVINVQDIVEVASYTSENKREEEKEAIANSQPMNVYINTEYINRDYNKDNNIQNTYEYLKTLEKFKDAEDC